MSTIKPNYARALDIKNGRVDMSHGSGGRAMAQLITELFATAFNNEYLAQGNDGALLPTANGRLVMATDSHVVSPLFFAGGDIGCLSVHGTINDVAVMGAKPLYLSAIEDPSRFDWLNNPAGNMDLIWQGLEIVGEVEVGEL